MPIWLLGSIVVVGLSGVALAAWGFGFARALVLDEALARAEFAADNQGLAADSLLLADSGRAALVTAGGRSYLMWVMGLDVATHGLAGATVAPARAGLAVQLGDFAAPRVRLALSPDEARRWTALIEEAA